jgi:predicted nucleotidyltransferase
MLGRRIDAVTDVIEARRTALEDLCQRHGVARLALFGSALRDVFDPDTSYLYLVVEFSPMSPSEHARACFGLLEDLENLFSCRVDLVEIGAVRNSYLRWEIEEHQETPSGALSGPLTQNW